MLIFQTKDGDEGDLRPYEVYGNDDEDHVDYNDKSNSVQEDLKEFNDMLGKRVMVMMDKMTLRVMMLLALSPRR